MRNYLLAGVSLVAIGIGGAANAADTLPPVGKTFCDPYKNYACMDSYLGQDFMTRFINYYRLEWGHEAAPSDPKAAASRRDGWPATPQSIPPMPFTEMALWRCDRNRRHASELGRQPADERDEQHGRRAVDERRAHSGLWLGQRRRQPQQQHRPRRQFAGGIRLQSEHGSARSGRGLYRAAARHSPEGPHRLGLPHRADLWRELSLHHGLRLVEQSAPSAEQELRL
ncbi:hypothetical protein ACVWZR_010045 [Bradyrhizobium sp. i1.3.1]